MGCRRAVAAVQGTRHRVYVAARRHEGSHVRREKKEVGKMVGGELVVEEDDDDE